MSDTSFGAEGPKATLFAMRVNAFSLLHGSYPWSQSDAKDSRKFGSAELSRVVDPAGDSRQLSQAHVGGAQPVLGDFAL
jgi:hypothetical protein